MLAHPLWLRIVDGTSLRSVSLRSRCFALSFPCARSYLRTVSLRSRCFALGFPAVNLAVLNTSSSVQPCSNTPGQLRSTSLCSTPRAPLHFASFRSVNNARPPAGVATRFTWRCYALNLAMLRAPLNTRARTSPLHSFGLYRNAFTSFGIASGRMASLRYAAAIWPLLSFALFPGLLPPSADAAAILLVLRYVPLSRLYRWQILTSAALLLCPLFATLATSCALVPPRS